MRLPVLVMTLLALGAGKAAAADGDVVSERESKPNVFYAQGGLGTPLGYVGFELARHVSPSFLVSAGAGMGVTGPQISLMPRLLLGQGRSVLVLGAGVSRGNYTSSTFCFDDESCAHRVGTANWANAEIGGEYRWPGGLSFRYFGGYGRAFADNLVCAGDAIDECNAHPSWGRSLVYTGFAFGQAF
jgi:hypothetical protein